MAMNLNGVLIDPLHGEENLQGRWLRACSDQSFTLDPLRIFRAFRFEADGWRLAPTTETLIKEGDFSTFFSAMPVERFSNELLKALSKKTPERFFQRMITCNIGGEFLPELFRMPQIPAGPLQHHPEGDLFTHSIQVLQRVAALTTDPLARFCAFFHDIGKLATDPTLYPKHHGHDEAGFPLAERLCTRLALSSAHRKALAGISRLHGKTHRWDEMRWATKIRTAEDAVKAGIVHILPLVAMADKPGNLPINGWDDAIKVARMTVAELEIDQEKLEQMKPKDRGPFISEQRAKLLKSRFTSS